MNTEILYKAWCVNCCEDIESAHPEVVQEHLDQGHVIMLWKMRLCREQQT